MRPQALPDILQCNFITPVLLERSVQWIGDDNFNTVPDSLDRNSDFTTLL
tara:strand:+ start:39310 stop:39459 length:150 start_codon:yes stop_codon:yes gene_type:complete